MNFELPDWYTHGSDEHQKAKAAWRKFSICQNENTAINLLEAIADANLLIPQDLTPWVYRITSAAKNAPNFKKGHKKSLTKEKERAAIRTIAFKVEIDGMTTTKAMEETADEPGCQYTFESLDRYWSSPHLKQFRKLSRAEGALTRILQDETMKFYGTLDKDELIDRINRDSRGPFEQDESARILGKKICEAFGVIVVEEYKLRKEGS